jgi:hypothetical protein
LTILETEVCGRALIWRWALFAALFALLKRGVALTRHSIALLERCVAFLFCGVALTCHAVTLLQNGVALTCHAIAFAGSRIPLMRSTSAQRSRRLPSPHGLLGPRPCRVALGQHSVAFQPRCVALGVSLVAFTECLGALGARPVPLTCELRRLAGRCSLSLGLRAQVGDAKRDLGVDHVVSLGDDCLARCERLAKLETQPLAVAPHVIEFNEGLIAGAQRCVVLLLQAAVVRGAVVLRSPARLGGVARRRCLSRRCAA